MGPSPTKPVLRQNCQSALGIEIATGGWSSLGASHFWQNYGLQVLSYEVVIFSFRNGIELLNPGFKCSFPGVNDANVM